MSQARSSVRRLPELDGLRGLACLLVVVWHYFGATTQGTLSDFAASLRTIMRPVGLSGVDLFFVLSGFLIAGILQDQRESRCFFRTFYLRRICRIFPVYFFVLACLGFALLFSLPTRFPAMREWLLKDMMPWPSYLTFTQNFWMAADIQSNGGGRWLAMTWSVAVEEQFYLLFPLVIRIASGRFLPWLMLLGVLTAPLFRQIATDQGLWFYTLLPCRFDCLGVGVLTSWMVRQARFRAFLSGRRYGLYGGLVGCFVLLNTIADPLRFHYSFVALLYGFVILLVVLNPDSIVAAICRNRCLVELGFISYAVYMFHQPLNGLMFAVVKGSKPVLASWSDAGLILLSLALVLGAALVSYRYFEGPILKLGHRAKW